MMREGWPNCRQWDVAVRLEFVVVPRRHCGLVALAFSTTALPLSALFELERFDVISSVMELVHDTRHLRTESVDFRDVGKEQGLRGS